MWKRIVVQDSLYRYVDSAIRQCLATITLNIKCYFGSVGMMNKTYDWASAL